MAAAPAAIAPHDRPRRRYAECGLQVAVVHHLTRRAFPHVLWLHPPNGACRSPKQAALLKRMGMQPGASDLVVAIAGRLHCLELKSGKGRQSADQQAFEAWCARAGVAYAVAHDLDGALEVLKQWGAFR